MLDSWVNIVRAWAAKGMYVCVRIYLHAMVSSSYTRMMQLCSRVYHGHAKKPRLGSKNALSAWLGYTLPYIHGCPFLMPSHLCQARVYILPNALKRSCVTQTRVYVLPNAPCTYLCVPIKECAGQAIYACNTQYTVAHIKPA
jgi:hypothetical protein